MRAHRGILFAGVALTAGTAAVVAVGPAQTRAQTRPQALPAPGPPAAPAVAARPAAPRPNIMVVTMDDMRWDELRHTPNVRRHLVRRGISFQNSFAPNPLCCPSRASFLKGVYSHRHGVLSHESPYGFGSFHDRSTLAGKLRRAGYRTGFVGKYLNGYGRQPSRVTGGSSLRYVPAGWEDWRAGVEFARWPGPRLAGGTYSYFSFTQNENGRLVPNQGDYSSTVIADDARALVRRYHRRRAPWFLWLNPVAPHHGMPDEPDDPRSFRRADGSLATFPTPARPRWVKGHYDRAIRHAQGLRANGKPSERDASDKPFQVRTRTEASSAERRAMLEVNRQRAESLLAWDHEFGRIVRTLKDTGEWRNTVIAFTSDNGYLMGEHRIRLNKIWSYEESLRVPLVIAGPGIRQGRRFAPATTVDLTATVLDLAGVPAVRNADGVSLVPLLRGPDRAWDRMVVTEGYLPRIRRRIDLPLDLTLSGFRLGGWKYARMSSGSEELYDLRSDPLELRNLAGVRRFRPRVRAARELWREYAGCAAAQCLARVPVEWRVDPAELARIHANAVETRRAYYG